MRRWIVLGIILLLFPLVLTTAQDTQADTSGDTESVSSETEATVEENAGESVSEDSNEPGEGNDSAAETSAGSAEDETNGEEAVESETGEQSDTSETTESEGNSSDIATATEIDEPEVEEEFVAPRVGQFLSVNGLDNWEYSLDISNYPDGKYNLVVRGIDTAGNEYFTPAIDIQIDQESDKPTVSITNPNELDIIRGNLNILGTALDDDAVGKVEVQIGDGEYKAATGTDYWSDYLDTSELPDGRYEIRVRAIDTHGVEGAESSVRFDLDKDKPVFDFTSHQNGELVNGRVTIEGTATDLNGIQTISYGDARESIANRLRFSTNRDNDTATFQLKIDTRDLEEGAHIYWFEATDKTGSSGSAALLLFVDNANPDIEILYPTEPESVNGIVTIVGRVSDEVGVSEFTAQQGDQEPESIVLAPGNPYWSKTFDFTGEKRTDVVFTAIDSTGNKIVEHFELPLNFEADRPTVTISYPPAFGQVYEDRFVGFVTDDDAVKELVYRIDKGDEIIVPAYNAFNLILPQLESGSHTITAYSIDVNGIEGPETSVEFTRVLEKPVIHFNTFMCDDRSQNQFSQGMAINACNIVSIMGTIDFANPKDAAEYRMGVNDADLLPLSRTDDPNTFSFEIPLNEATIPYGYLDIAVTAVDTYGQSTTETAAIVVANLTKVQVDHGVYLSDSRADADGPIKLTSELKLRYLGFPVKSIELRPASEIVSVSQRDGFITVSPRNSGTSEPLHIVITSDRGTEFSSGPYVFETDFNPPRLVLDTSVISGRIQGAVNIRGSVSDDVGVARVFYTIGENDTNLPITESNGDLQFAGRITSTRISAEGTVVRFTAVDTAGNVSTVYRTFSSAPNFVADPEAKRDPKPVLSVLAPVGDDPLLPSDLENGSVYISGIITGVPRVGSIVFSVDNGDDRQLSPGEVFEMRLPRLSAGKHRVTLRAYSDLEVAGNSVRVDFEVAADTYDISVTAVMQDDEASQFSPGMILEQNADLSLVGALTPGRDAARVSYSIDEATSVAARVSTGEDGSRTFTIPVRTSLELGRHDVEITSTDELGEEIVHRTFFYLVEPQGDRRIQDEPGLYIADDRYNEASSERIVMSSDDSFTVMYIGRPIETYRILPERSDVRVRKINNRFIITTNGIGYHDDFRLDVITVDGDEYTTPELSFTVDDSAPAITYEPSIVGSWFQNRISFPISVSDDLEIASVEAALVVPVSGAADPEAAAPKPNYTPLKLFTSGPETSEEETAQTEDATPAAQPDTGNSDSTDESDDSESSNESDGDSDTDTDTDTAENSEETATEPETSTAETPADGSADTSSTADSADTASDSADTTDATEESESSGESASTEDNADTGDGETAEEEHATDTTSDDSKESESAESSENGEESAETTTESFASMTPSAAGETNEYLIDLDSERLPDGPVEVRIRVTDTVGNTTEVVVPVVKDATPPEFAQITPPTGSTVNGLFTLVSRIIETSPVESIVFTDDGENFQELNPERVFDFDLDLASYEELPDEFIYEVTDEAGNKAQFIPSLELDLEADKPVVDLQLPSENSVIRNDFIVSGMVFDDDEVAGIRYRFDGGEWIELDGAVSFEVEVLLEDTTDNEHIVEFQAFDLGGVMSDIESTTYYISKADPVSKLLSPSIETTNRGIVTIIGESFDANGIEEVFLSFDNGNTYNVVLGTDIWFYTFDSTTLIDGTYSLLIRAVDSTGGIGLYTSLLNVDNEDPTLSLTGLLDGAQITDELYLQGSATDTIGLKEMYVEIVPFETYGMESEDLYFDLVPQRIVLKRIDVSHLMPGWYNLRITAVDRADNIAYVSRNWRKMAADEYSRIDILFPAPGEPLAGEFALQGRMVTTKMPEKAAVFIDQQLFEATDIDENGYFNVIIAPELLDAGYHSVRIEATLPDETKVSTIEYLFTYNRVGPWARIDSFSAGDFASNRPWVTGRAGYFADGEESVTDERAKELAAERKVVQVDYSIDNGRTFLPARGREEWRFRLETLDMPDEKLNLLVRATYKNGEKAITKTQIEIDDTDPTVALLSPDEGRRFNEVIELSGTAYDASGLKEVAVQLRRGGKGQYEVPSFVQGLYIDARILGATFWEAGFGLTFFDDNVKLQVQIGTAPSGRFSGMVIGAKLLANIGLLPYSVISQDLAFLSSSFAVGATFSYFSMSGSTINVTEDGLFLAAVILQAEVVRFDFERLGINWPVMKAVSLYTEGQFWFISSDVEGGTEARLAFGIRSEIF